MSKLIEYLEKIESKKTLQALKKDPTTLSIGYNPHLNVNEITISNLKDVLDVLKGDKSVIKLNIYDFGEQEAISLLADFFKDQECFITNVNICSDSSSPFFKTNDDIRIFSQAIAKNNTIEAIDLSSNPLGDQKLAILLAGLKQKSNFKVLDLTNTEISLTGEAGGCLVQFVKNTNLTKLYIANNPIACKDLVKLLKAISEKNTIEVLNMDGLHLDDSVVDAFASLISQGSNIIEIGASLCQISNTSGEKLLTAIQNNKIIISCMIFDANEDQMSNENKEVNQELQKAAEQNYEALQKVALRKVAQVLKDFYEVRHISLRYLQCGSLQCLI